MSGLSEKFFKLGSGALKLYEGLGCKMRNS
jgi:hypothetical protein